MSFVEEIDITIGDPPILDLHVYDSWLCGDLHSTTTTTTSSSSFSLSSSLIQSFEDATDRREDNGGDICFRGPTFYSTDGEIMQRNMSETTLVSLRQKEKLDQYRLFNHLEHYFSFPMILTPHLGIWFQIPQPVQSSLIEKYYHYDESIMREIINRKLAKSRKDLEDISEATDIPVLRVTRQSDNIKRMYSYLEEDRQFKGNLIKFVEVNFLLSLNLCRRYACLLFFLYSKFNITSKKRLLKLPCVAVEKSCALIIAFILPDSKQFNRIGESHIQSTSDNIKIPECLVTGNDQDCWDLVWDLCEAVDSIDPDKTLMINLRELRNIFIGESLDACVILMRENLLAIHNDSAQVILNKLGTTVSSGNANIRGIIKSLLLIGAHLSQAKEFRDIIEDIVTTLDEFTDETGLTVAEINVLLLSASVLGDCIPISSDVDVSRTLSSIDTISRSSGGKNTVDEYKFARLRSDVVDYNELIGNSRFELMRDWCRFLSTCRLCYLACTR